MLPKYEDQDPRVIDLISNGCGGKGSLIDPPDGKYGCCCDKHDFGYTVGGTEEDRQRVDGEFLVDMVSVAVQQKRGIRRFLSLLTAILYFYGVAYAGKRYFRYGTPLTQIEIDQQYGSLLEEETKEEKETQEIEVDPILQDLPQIPALPLDTDLRELKRRLDEI